jgi:hypothetical protein
MLRFSAVALGIPFGNQPQNPEPPDCIDRNFGHRVNQIPLQRLCWDGILTWEERHLWKIEKIGFMIAVNASLLTS